MANKKPKIHILYKFIEGPWGGGNQFLKALRDYFIRAGIYSADPQDADVLIFNSYPFGNEHLFDLSFRLKQREPNKILIHRVNGPIFYIRGRDEIVDRIILRFNSCLADGTVFQSNWSREKNYEIGAAKSPYETVIINAPDAKIFNPKPQSSLEGRKIRLMATSWSANIRKGFDIYQHLDEHLDFNRYEMTFIGNSPIEFKNINWIRAIPNPKLAKELKKHDIYIIASKSDPCSNALLEALHCGLPAVARKDGGHKELVGKAGVLFEDGEGAIKAIDEVAQHYEHYRRQINLPTLDEAGEKYYQFAQMIHQDCLSGNYRPKQVSLFDNMMVRMKIIQWRLQKRLQGLRIGLG